MNLNPVINKTYIVGRVCVCVCQERQAAAEYSVSKSRSSVRGRHSLNTERENSAKTKVINKRLNLREDVILDRENAGYV